MNSTAAIFDRLSTNTEIAFQLEMVGSRQAIFNDRAPDNFAFGKKAVLVIAAPTEDSDASTYSETIRAIRQDVRIYAKDTGSTAMIDQLARDIRKLFHNRPAEMSVDGGTVTIATATGPVASPTTDPSLIGRRVTLRLELQEN